MNKIYVIGMGYKPFDKRAIDIIDKAKVIFASNRLFDMFKGYEEFERVKDRTKVINNVYGTMDGMKSAMESEPQGPIVLLASGDPMFSGIGSKTVKEFGKEVVEILPDLSSIQVAFSRIKEPSDDALFMSLHGGPDPEKRRRLPYGIDDIPILLRHYQRIAILTDKENNPSAIAKVLPPEATIYVLEKLGYPDERITAGTGEEISNMTFLEPNVVIIKKSEVKSETYMPQGGTNPNENNPPQFPPLSLSRSDSIRGKGGEGGFSGEKLEVKGWEPGVRFGLRENEIIHPGGLITKDEVRAVTLHKLRLPQRGVFWDIGAGSGSISVEAARLYPQLLVFAIEKRGEQIKCIEENRLKFEALNIKIIKGDAPEALTDLPAPERVFIGGSGGRLKEIIDSIAQTLAKHIVINAATLETIHEAMQCLENDGFDTEVTEVSISRTKVMAGKRHMSALNPVFIITGERRI